MSHYNHTCKNPYCPNKIVDKNGKAQPNYYACDTCDRLKGRSWRALCCSPTCYIAYMEYLKDRKMQRMNTIEKSVEADKKVATAKTTKKHKKATGDSAKTTQTETEVETIGAVDNVGESKDESNKYVAVEVEKTVEENTEVKETTEDNSITDTPIEEAQE